MDLWLGTTYGRIFWGNKRPEESRNYIAISKIIKYLKKEKKS